MDAFKSRQVEGGLRKKNQMTEDGSCQLDGRFWPNVCQPAGFYLPIHFDRTMEASLVVYAMLLFPSPSSSLFLHCSLCEVTSRTKTQKKDLTKARSPILNGADISKRCFSHSSLLDFEFPIIPFIIHLFFRYGTDSQGSAARCEEAGDSCEAGD